jgi:hypothetical protein
LRRDRAAGIGERAAWSGWATAWSSTRGYRASTAAGRWGAGLSPLARRWADGRTPLKPVKNRFRDRWQEGEV